MSVDVETGEIESCFIVNVLFQLQIVESKVYLYVLCIGKPKTINFPFVQKWKINGL